MPLIFGLVQNNSLVISPGTFHSFGGGATPSGWLVCDGSAVSRTVYAALFSAIGTIWGVGDGSTTFNIPDGRGRSLMGSGTGAGLSARTLGQTLGEEAHPLVVGELAAHAHGVSDPGHQHVSNDLGNGNTGQYGTAAFSGSLGSFSGASPLNIGSITSPAGTGLTVQSNGSGTGHNTIHPVAVALSIIKY